MKEYLEERLPSEDWEVEQFTAEDVVNFHNTYTHLTRLERLNTNIKKANNNLDTKRRNLGLVSLIFSVSIVITSFIEFLTYLPFNMLFLYILYTKVVSVTKARDILKEAKNNLMEYVKIAKW